MGKNIVKNEIKKKIKYVIKLIAYPFISLAFLFRKRRKFKIFDDKTVVDKIVKEGYSISRFGDGEFLWILGKNKKSFQDNSKDLSNDLKNILVNYKSNKKVLIGIYGTFNDLSAHTFNSKIFWKYFILKYGKQVYDILPDETYCDTALTRPYMDYKNKNFDLMQSKFENLKRIWNDRDVIIVEGEYTRLGVNNDLFDNCKSRRRILCPPKNAYFKYNEIVDAIKKVAKKEDLILISLGPTATVLAYNLAEEGLQCIDTGHIDIEYMWFKNGVTVKSPIKGKYVNEVNNGKIDDVENEEYLKEIITKVTL